MWSATEGFDPMPHGARVSAPVSAALGEGHDNVPVAESVFRFESPGCNVGVAVCPEGGHAITDPASGQVQRAVLNDLVVLIPRALRAP